MSRSAVSSSAQHSPIASAPLIFPIPVDTREASSLIGLQLPPLPTDPKDPVQSQEAKFAERLRQGITAYEKATGRSFDTELSLWSRKEGKEFVLNDERLNAVKDVIKKAMDLPQGFDIKLSVDANGDARFNGRLQGEFILRDKSVMGLLIDRASGEILLDGKGVRFSEFVHNQRAQDVATVVGRYPKAIEFWDLGEAAPLPISKESRSKILDEFSAALGVPPGTLSDLVLTKPTPNSISISLRAGEKEVSAFTSTITQDPNTKALTPKYELKPIAIPKKGLTDLPPLPPDKNP